MKISDIIKRLSPESLLDAATRSVGASAQRIATLVQAELSDVPGETDTFPAARTGALASSIVVSVTEVGAVVGSTDPVATLQEMGTRLTAPRPFLAPAAAESAEDVAQLVGSAVREAIGNGLTATL